MISKLSVAALLAAARISTVSAVETWGFQPNAEICTMPPDNIHDECVSNDLEALGFRVLAAETMAEACPSFQPSDCDYGQAVQDGNTIPNFDFVGTIENCGGSTRPSAGLDALLMVVPTPDLIYYCASNGYGTPPQSEIFNQVFCYDATHPTVLGGVVGGTCGALAKEFPLGDFFLVCGYQFVITTGSIMYWSTASKADTCNKFQQCIDRTPKCSGTSADYVVELPCGDAPWCTNEPILTSSPTPNPTPNPTLAPTPAVTAALTPNPTAAPTPAPITETTTEPPAPFGCRRRLQDLELERKWNISEPLFDYESLKFTLDFEISDFIASVDQVKSTLYLDDCEGTYTGSALNDVVGTIFTSVDNDGKQNIAVEIDIDPSVISSETQIYSEQDPIGAVTADVDFCVRVGLHTPTVAGGDEINYLETIVRLDVDLSDGFEIASVSVEPRDKCALAAEEEFLVEGYFCQDNFEFDADLGQAAPINQGDIVKICVRPQQRGLENFVRMRRISSFTFTRDTAPAISQVAIENALPASNGLTEVFCSPGFAICFFETILYASFFTESATIGGSGVADLQFGGEQSEISVSPRVAIGKRALAKSDQNESRIRFLQSAEAESAAEVAFDLTVDVQQGLMTFDDSNSAALAHREVKMLLSALAGFVGIALVL